MESSDNYCVYGGRRYSKFDGVPSDHLIPEKAKLIAQFLGAFLFGLPLGILASYVWKYDHTFDPVLTIIITVLIGYWCGLGYKVPPSLTLQEQIDLYGEPAWPYPPSLYARIESVLVVLFKISFGLLCVLYLWINNY